MGDMLIRGIPDALKIEIEGAARQEGQSLSARAIDLMRKGLLFEREAAGRPKQSAWDMIRSIYEHEGPVTGEFARIMDEIEAERKRDFGRTVEFGGDDDVGNRS